MAVIGWRTSIGREGRDSHLLASSESMKTTITTSWPQAPPFGLWCVTPMSRSSLLSFGTWSGISSASSDVRTSLGGTTTQGKALPALWFNATLLEAQRMRQGPR